jgi:hypothetical protein
VHAVAAGDAKGGVWEVCVGGALGGNVDVGHEQVLRVDQRWPVGDADHGHGQLEEALEDLGALDARLLPRRRLEDLAQARAVDLLHERVAGAGEDEGLVVRVEGAISSKAAGKSSWVWPVKVIGPPLVWKRITSTPSSPRVKARFSYLSKYAGVDMDALLSSLN